LDLAQGAFAGVHLSFVIQTPPWHPGLSIVSRYRLRALLGKGAAAEVWRAFDARLEATVAIKLLVPQFAGTEVARRFLQEARASAQLRSLHVVQILDHGLHGMVPYITMELLEGETLSARLGRLGSLTPQALDHVFGHVAKAVAKAHAAGIIHRDLKPSNVFIVHGDDPDEEIAKVFDFGIAKVERPAGSAPATGVTRAGTLLGTPGYMSPEQARGATIDHRTDLYALGVLACEAATGRVPFESDDLGDILRAAVLGELVRPSSLGAVPPGFDAWFARSTALEPAARFSSAKEQAAALHEVLAVA
jgi:serine/threonine-protein kinase